MFPQHEGRGALGVESKERRRIVTAANKLQVVRALGIGRLGILGMHMDHQTLRQKASLWMAALDRDETLFVLDEWTWMGVVWSARQAWRPITNKGIAC